MKAGIAGLACALGLFAASPAHACWSVDSHVSVFTVLPPTDVAPGMSVFKVRVPRDLRRDDWYPIEVRILQGPKALDPRLLVLPGPQTDCSSWGDTTGPVYVVGKLTYGAGGRMFLMAAQRRRRTL